MLTNRHPVWHRLIALLAALSLTFMPMTALSDLRSAPAWYDSNAVGSAPDWHYRVPITIPAGNAINSTIKVDVNFTTLLTQMGVSGTFDVNSPRVVRPNGTLSTNQEFTDVIFAGATDAANDGKGEVRFILEDAGPSTYYLYFDITQNGAKPGNPQTPINGNFEQSPVVGTQNPPGWTGAKTNAAFDAQLVPSEMPNIGTNGGVAGNGAQPRITDGTPLTGGFSYLIGSRTNNEPAGGNPAVTLQRTIAVPASNPGNLVLRYRVEGWDSAANGNNTQYDFFADKRNWRRHHRTGGAYCRDLHLVPVQSESGDCFGDYDALRLWPVQWLGYRHQWRSSLRHDACTRRGTLVYPQL